MAVEYTDEQMTEFRELVEKGESQDQVDRIESRLRMPTFISKHGREVCDAMFEVLKKEMEDDE